MVWRIEKYSLRDNVYFFYLEKKSEDKDIVLELKINTKNVYWSCSA